MEDINKYIYTAIVISTLGTWFKIFYLIKKNELKQITLVYIIYAYVMFLLAYLVSYFFDSEMLINVSFAIYIYILLHYKFFWIYVKKFFEWLSLDIKKNNSNNSIKDNVLYKKRMLKNINKDINLKLNWINDLLKHNFILISFNIFSILALWIYIYILILK